MSKFTPDEIDAMLNAKATRPASDDIPAGFFDDFADRVVEAATADPSDTNTIVMQPRPAHRKWWYVAAAAVLLFVCGFAVQHVRSIATTIESHDDIYAVTDDMTEDDINDLDELYEADVFLEEL